MNIKSSPPTIGLCSGAADMKRAAVILAFLLLVYLLVAYVMFPALRMRFARHHPTRDNVRTSRKPQIASGAIRSMRGNRLLRIEILSGLSCRVLPALVHFLAWPGNAALLRRIRPDAASSRRKTEVAIGKKRYRAEIDRRSRRCSRDGSRRRAQVSNRPRHGRKKCLLFSDAARSRPAASAAHRLRRA